VDYGVANKCYCTFSRKDGVWVGHLLSNYSLPMEEPIVTMKTTGNQRGIPDSVLSQIGGSWKEAISEAVTTTKSAFPGADVVAHLDSK
jgi:D-aminoacyl-tRNA deacylase